MKEKTKVFGFSIAWIMGFFVLLFAISLISLGYYKFFAPRYENARREVFESTKSYIQGVQQDLGKYYLEYQKAESEKDREAIKATIQMRFAEVDAGKLQSLQLRRFLVRMRGY